MFVLIWCKIPYSGVNSFSIIEASDVLKNLLPGFFPCFEFMQVNEFFSTHYEMTQYKRSRNHCPRGSCCSSCRIGATAADRLRTHTDCRDQNDAKRSLSASEGDSLVQSFQTKCFGHPFVHLETDNFTCTKVLPPLI
jgi:hypothetical protein